MQNIAIFSSGEGESSRRIAELFNEGNRIRIRMVLTDNPDAGISTALSPFGIDVRYISPAEWQETPSAILRTLKDCGIELVALDDFRGTVPQEIADAYADRLVTLSDPGDAPRRVVDALREDLMRPATPAAPEPSRQKSVDEEWAETLKIKYDPSQIRTTPPPIPGTSAAPAAPAPVQTQNAAAGGDMPSSQAPMPSTYIIWSVLATIFCCFIPGIVAIIFSSQVSTRYLSGDLEGARRASSRAQITNTTS